MNEPRVRADQSVRTRKVRATPQFCAPPARRPSGPQSRTPKEIAMTDRRRFIVRAAAGLPSLAALLGAAAPRRAAAGSLLAELGDLVKDDPGTLSVVLIDISASVAAEDRRLYEGAASALVAAAGPADRVVLAAVGERPASRFIAQADRRFAGGGNTMQDEARARQMRKALREDFDALLAPKGTPTTATCIIDAIVAAGELLGQGREAGQLLRLVVLSDMIEESARANFKRSAPTQALTERLLGELRRNKLMPSLAGVQVHVVGASGASAEQMARVKAFWLAFFAAAGAHLASYGRAPLVLPA